MPINPMGYSRILDLLLAARGETGHGLRVHGAACRTSNGVAELRPNSPLLGTDVVCSACSQAVPGFTTACQASPAGPRIRLQLQTADTPYLRPNTNPFAVAVLPGSSLEVPTTSSLR